MSSPALSDTAPPTAASRPAAALAALLLAGGSAWLGSRYGWRHGALFAIGGLLGVSLYHAAFGFTAAWRALIVTGRGEGVRAQMLMLAVASAIFLPLLAAGEVFGQKLGGAVAPLGLSVAAGAFLFGIGMQLGGGCASGTLYAAGGGGARPMVTLAFFVVGSLIGSAHVPWWTAQGDLGSVALVPAIGLLPALAVQFALFGLIAWCSLAWQKRRAPPPKTPPQRFDPLRGPWPLLWGALALALLNAATLVVSGHPWSITFGFSLWGAKAAQALGIDVAGWAFWSWTYPAWALRAGIFAETTSVMNMGILLGALLAAGLAGRLRPDWRIGARPLLAAVLGGLLLGYGARLAYGCNIGAFFSGVASGSLHGWLWLIAALPGNWLGVRLRPLFRLG